jgi:hypothetical protein
VPFCPLAAHVVDVDGTRTRYAVVLTSLETGRASGIVSLYAGNTRYDVPFHNAVALDTRDLKTPATPIVVRFAASTVLDGAAVTSIEDNGTNPCDPVFSPWSSILLLSPQTPEDRRRHELLVARARAEIGIEAPTPVADRISCAVPYRLPRTTFAFEPTTPYRDARGIAHVLVLLGPDNRVLGTRIEQSAGNEMMDNVALYAVAHSRFEGAIFRCRPVFGTYIFSVEFNG